MTLYLQDPDVTLYHGDALEVLKGLPDQSVHMCATSPPFYGLRDYGTGTWEGGNPECDHKQETRHQAQGSTSQRKGRTNADDQRNENFRDACGRCGARRVDQQIGLEETPDAWVANLVAVFREVKRVLRDDGTLWVEIGDSYAGAGYSNHENTGGVSRENGGSQRHRSGTGHKPKDLLGQPWMLAFALRADGWYLRSEIVWSKPNPMPESVTDRPTKSHSTVFLLSKLPRYFFDADAIREPYRSAEEGLGGGANARSVWTIPTEPTPFAHFATWPKKLVARMILAGTSERGVCPECGAPWVRETERVQTKQGENYESRMERWGEDFTPAHQGGRSFQVPIRYNLSQSESRTLGWLPSCDHDSDPVPAVVLDPFAGSGTTLIVARSLGRRSIGVELNEEYCQLVRDRTMQQSLLAV